MNNAVIVVLHQEILPGTQAGCRAALQTKKQYRMEIVSVPIPAQCYFRG